MKLMYALSLALLVGCASLEKPRQYVFMRLVAFPFGPICESFITTDMKAVNNVDIYDGPLQCKDSEKYKQILEETQKAAKEKDKEAKIESKRQHNKKIDKIIKEKPQFKKYEAELMAYKILIGMPEELIVVSWGEPENINQTVLANSINKQFVYKNYNYVYTKNGVVSAIQNNH